MKLLVFSDNHKDVLSVDWMLLAHRDADRIISLGDSEMTEAALSSRNIFGVRGNYPFEPDFPDELVFEFEGHKTFITHGHHFYVKTGLYSLLQEARSRGCDLVLFGHTHQYLAAEEDGVILVNPGSTSYPKAANRRTYAVITVTKPRIKVEIIALESGIPIETFVKKY
jgi:putative phosphoesterase